MILLKITIFLTLSLSCLVADPGGAGPGAAAGGGGPGAASPPPPPPPLSEGLDPPLITVSSQVVQGPN